MATIPTFLAMDIALAEQINLRGATEAETKIPPKK